MSVTVDLGVIYYEVCGVVGRDLEVVTLAWRLPLAWRGWDYHPCVVRAVHAFAALDWAVRSTTRVGLEFDRYTIISHHNKKSGLGAVS